MDIKHLSFPPSKLATLPFPLSAPLKVVWQVVNLLYVLLLYGDYGSEYMLVQVRPATILILLKMGVYETQTAWAPTRTHPPSQLSPLPSSRATCAAPSSSSTGIISATPYWLCGSVRGVRSSE